MRKSLIFILLGFLIAFVLYATLFSTVFTKAIIIKAPLAKINQQISSVKYISKWYLPFASADTSTINILGKENISLNNNYLSISNLSGLSALYKVSENNRPNNVLFSLALNDSSFTKVTLSYKCSLWNKIFSKNPNFSNAENSLQNLNEYFQDAKKMYGYPIEEGDVSDTTFLFTSKVVSKNVKKEAFKNLFESLIQYADQKKLGYNGIRIFYTSPYGNDSIHLFTSIGISVIDQSAFNDKFLLKKMPYRGHLLSAFYQGSFGNISNVIDALDQFRNDHEMTSMAIPFVKLITQGVDFDDSQIIQAKAYYPIF